MFLTHTALLEKSTIFNVLLFLKWTKAHFFFHIGCFRRQHGSFLGAVEPGPEPSGALAEVRAEVREAAASVGAEANPGKRGRPRDEARGCAPSSPPLLAWKIYLSPLCV